MKRFLTSLVLLLAAASALHAQDGRVIARLSFPLDAQLYTFLDGEIGEHFSYSLSNHWISGADTKALYENTWRAWDSNWCDWAYIEFNTGGFSLSAGKIIMLNALQEFSASDVDNYPILCSSHWNGITSYELGTTASYCFEDAGITAQLQFSASPFDEKPFEGHYAVSAGLQGDFGLYKPCLAVNRCTMDEEEWGGLGKLYAVSFGNAFQVSESLLLNLDYLGRFSPSAGPSTTILAGMDYSFLQDKMHLIARAGWDYSEDELADSIEFGGEGFFGGLALEYRPVNLVRLHAAGGYNQTLGALYDVGVSIDFEFKL